MPKHDELISWGWAKPAQYWQNAWRKYRMTPEKFEVIWHEQGGECAGCTRPFAHPVIKVLGKLGIQPNIDHLHKFDEEGKELQCEFDDVRGLLCARCNMLIGKLRDDIQLTRRLYEYMKAHGEV